ncbi:hypothetical protein ACFL54_09540 [Planctomycetota bacterium]
MRNICGCAILILSLLSACGARGELKTVQKKRPGDSNPLAGIPFLTVDVRSSNGVEVSVTGFPEPLVSARDPELEEMVAVEITWLICSKYRAIFLDNNLLRQTRTAYLDYQQGIGEFQVLFNEVWVKSPEKVQQLVVELESAQVQREINLEYLKNQHDTNPPRVPVLLDRAALQYRVTLTDHKGITGSELVNGTLALVRSLGLEEEIYRCNFMLAEQFSSNPQCVRAAMAAKITRELDKVISPGHVAYEFQALSGDREIRGMLESGSFDRAFDRIESVLADDDLPPVQRGFWLHDQAVALAGRGHWRRAMKVFQAAAALSGREESRRALFRLQELAAGQTN